MSAQTPPPNNQPSQASATAAGVGVGIVLGMGIGWLITSLLTALLMLGASFYLYSMIQDIETEMEENDYEDWEERI